MLRRHQYKIRETDFWRRTGDFDGGLEPGSSFGEPQVIWNEPSLRRILKSYRDYYLRSRTHLALGKDAPESRPIQPPELGPVMELPEVGGLHHRYERRAA